jgi:hypothetical protein
MGEWSTGSGRAPRPRAAEAGATSRTDLEGLQRRNYSQTTVKGYLKIVEAFAKCFHRSPDQLGPEQIRATEACR